MAEVVRNEEQIESLKQSFPEGEAASDAPFQLSKSTKSTSVEFLSENDVEISTWISEADESNLVHKCLRLWFTLCKQYNQEPWCQFPGDDQHFYASAKVVLLTEAQQLCKSTSVLLTYFSPLHQQVHR